MIERPWERAAEKKPENVQNPRMKLTPRRRGQKKPLSRRRGEEFCKKEGGVVNDES